VTLHKAATIRFRPANNECQASSSWRTSMPARSRQGSGPAPRASDAWGSPAARSATSPQDGSPVD
jgi:hypothetical protein